MSDELRKILSDLREFVKKVFEKLIETIRGFIKRTDDSAEEVRQLPIRSTFKIVKKTGKAYKPISYKRSIIYRCRNNC